MEGAPPDYLADLAPNYLSPELATLPETQIANTDPKIDITIPYGSIDPESAGRVAYTYDPPTDTADWELAISVYLGSFQSVIFVYTPNQVYPDDYGRLGDWGYRGAY